MKLWNFAHGLFFIVRNLHLYEFLGLVFVAIMVIALIVHFIREKKRKDEYEDDLRIIESGGPIPGKAPKKEEKV